MNGKRHSTFIKLITEIRSDPKFAKLKYITGVGKYGEILSNALETELKLRVIEIKDAILYPVEEVLVISDTLENTRKLKSYEKRGYLTYVLWQDDE